MCVRCNFWGLNITIWCWLSWTVAKYETDESAPTRAVFYKILHLKLCKIMLQIWQLPLKWEKLSYGSSSIIHRRERYGEEIPSPSGLGNILGDFLHLMIERRHAKESLISYMINHFEFFLHLLPQCSIALHISWTVVLQFRCWIRFWNSHSDYK